MISHAAVTRGVRPIAVLLAAVSFGVSCSHTRSTPVMSWAEYEQVRHVVPYVLDISAKGGGRLIYVGSDHTKDPESLSIRTIESLWAQSRPELAFNEGGYPPVAPSREEAIRSGEAGLVVFLAAQSNVPSASLDPTRTQLAARLSPIFGAELVKLGFVLSQVRQHRNSSAQAFEERMAHTFAVLNATPGLEGRPGTLEELAEVFCARFPETASFRDAPDSWFDPVQKVNVMNELARRSSEERDRFMVELLVRHVRQGKRVFAVVGASHVVMQERALRDALSIH
jgi:hypothetical protein